MNAPQTHHTARNGPPIDVLAAIAAGGAIGTLARWALTTAMTGIDAPFPWATYTENIIGSFALGMTVSIILIRRPQARLLPAFLGIGVLGSFTTFSAFSHEALLLLTDQLAPLAILYATSSVLCGLLAASFGTLLGRAMSIRIATRSRPG